MFSLARARLRWPPTRRTATQPRDPRFELRRQQWPLAGLPGSNQPARWPPTSDCEPSRPVADSGGERLEGWWKSPPRWVKILDVLSCVELVSTGSKCDKESGYRAAVREWEPRGAKPFAPKTILSPIPHCCVHADHFPHCLHWLLSFGARLCRCHMASTSVCNTLPLIFQKDGVWHRDKILRCFGIFQK